MRFFLRNKHFVPCVSHSCSYFSSTISLYVLMLFLLLPSLSSSFILFSILFLSSSFLIRSCDAHRRRFFQRANSCDTRYRSTCVPTFSYYILANFYFNYFTHKNEMTGVFLLRFATGHLHLGSCYTVRAFAHDVIGSAEAAGPTRPHSPCHPYSHSYTGNRERNLCVKLQHAAKLKLENVKY